MVLGHDLLDSMAWDVAAIGVLIAMGALTLRSTPSSKSIEDDDKNRRVGFSIASGAAGLYLFLGGLEILFTWPFSISSGVYNVLFGGIATLGGLVALSGSIMLYLNADPRPISYFAAVAGIYAMVDAYGILKYNLTSSPALASLGYLSFAAPALLSVPAAHLKNKYWKWLFVIFALLFAAAWIYQAANFTLAHLNPS